MKLMRVGPPGQERPAVLLPDGTAVDASPVAADYDTVFFASGGLDDLARALEDRRLEPLSANRLEGGSARRLRGRRRSSASA